MKRTMIAFGAGLLLGMVLMASGTQAPWQHGSTEPITIYDTHKRLRLAMYVDRDNVVRIQMFSASGSLAWQNAIP